MKKLLIFITFLFALKAEYQEYKPNEHFAKYFTREECSLILHQYYYINCYSFEYKSSKAVAYKLQKQNLLSKQIKKRPSFKSDLKIPKEYRTYSKDYTHSGYDRGHILSNASMRATKEAQESTFLMSNITPQNPFINREIWKNIEDRERKFTIENEEIEVLNIIIYDDNPKYINNYIAIPIGYIKVLASKDKEECYLVPNIAISKEDIKNFQFDCKQIP